VEECIFCEIAAGSSPAQVVWDSEQTIFFYDISPKAKIHVVGIPKKHIPSLNEVSKEEARLVGQLLSEVPTVAAKAGIDPALGYRVITNVGQHGGQEISHLHWHILGGESVGKLRC
jgi:histidine triad (HIT) family protein